MLINQNVFYPFMRITPFSSDRAFIILSGKSCIVQKYYNMRLTFSQTSPGFYVSAVQDFEITVRKGETARNEQFILFPQCFLPVWRAFCHFQLT